MTIPWVSAGTIVTTLAAVHRRRGAEALTWPPTQTLAKVADAGGVRAASVKAVAGGDVNCRETLQGSCGHRKGPEAAHRESACGAPVPQEPAVVLVVPPSTVTDVTSLGLGRHDRYQGRASAPEERVRERDLLPTQT